MNILREFPKLARSSYKVTSKPTDAYNCIAFAAGNYSKWWWPDRDNTNYWPVGIPREETLDAFLKMFEGLGYERCKDGSHEDGFEKVAIFTRGGTPTHAARSDGPGFWKSKLGPIDDIRHSLTDVGGVDAGEYGTVDAFMRRRVGSSADEG